MKIWYQSATEYGFDPVWDDYGKSLHEQCKRVARPDTEIHIEGIEVMIRDVTNYPAFKYYEKSQVINNIVRAEREGYDVVAIGCTLDLGLEEGRSLVNIPVVSIAESSFHMALMLGHLYAVVTSSMAFFNAFKQLTEKYGVASHYLPGPYVCPASEEEIALSLKNPEPLWKKFEAVARRAVDDGASVLLPFPTFYASLALKAGVRTIGDAAILDAVSVLVKTAEMMADLKAVGVAPSRCIGVYALQDETDQQRSLDRLRKVFRID